MIFTDAIIMCAGKGARLMPLTEGKPKAMVEVSGKPIIRWILEALEELNIDNIYLITGYKEGTLKSYVKYNFNKKITCIHQNKRTGTADAIYLAKKYIRSDFIVLAGDTIFEIEDLKELIKIPNSLLYTKQNVRLFEYGTIEFGNNRILKIHEKSTNPVSNMVNCSAYHFTPDIFKYIPDTHIDARFNERIITNTINLMINNGVEFHGIYMKDLNEISYPEDIEIVEKRL